MTTPSIAIDAFLPFYTGIVPRERVDRRLRPLVAAVAPAHRVEPLLNTVWTDLAVTVEGLAFRTLIAEFHDFREQRGLPMTTTDGPALRAFRAHLSEPTHARQLLGRYPVLEQRLETIVRQSLEPYAEIFAAYAADRAELHAAGLLPAADETIVGLSATGGDLHNDNHKVVGVELSGGTRIIYKPRTLDSDEFVRDLYAAVDPHLAYSLRDCLPRSVSVGDHGWQEFVTPRAMTGDDQPSRYFYRFGALCAIFGTIGASDLHDENLIAGGEYPCVIDTETIVRPDSGVDSDTLPHRLANQLKLSIASTMLVPMLDPTSRNDLNMSGVGVAGEQTSKMQRPVVHDNDTDGIAVRWLPVTYQQTDNVPRLGERALVPTDWFADIRAGYVDALAAVRDGSITKVLTKHPAMPVRCLIRSTMVYGRFLDAASHPDYLRRQAESERVLNLLGQYPPHLSAEAAAYVGEQERAALRTGNIPLFQARAGSTELATARTAFAGAHKWSALEFAQRGVRQNAEQPDTFHHFLLEETFAEIAGPGGMSRHSVFGPALAAARPGQWWTGIARTIAAVGVSHQGAAGAELGWVCGIGPDRAAPTLAPGTFISFHDSGGIVAFLRHAAHHDADLREVHRSAERGLDSLLADYPDGLLKAPESVLTGATSLLLSRPDVDEDWLARAFGGIARRAEAGTLETDLGNGPAGVLMLLLARMENGLDPAAGEAQLRLLRDLTVQHLDVVRDKPWFDVAHGELGLRWAAARIGRVLGDAALARSSADWLAERLTGGELSPVPGWCNGAAGLALSAAEIMASAGRTDWLVGPRLDAILDSATELRPGQPVDLSVCHGSSGVIQALLGVARILGDDSLIGRAVDHQRRVIGAARTDGFATGAPGRTSLLGYFLGWSGVGDTDLLLRAAGAGEWTGALPVAFTGPTSV
ncbi:type 2 lantibiotic biosynthesis protein LanM [Krasilnikovia cinnamomea]|uniref:Type 2 lantibiotic biosynthesis protein LanM n=1 Tax=Krasilnikovia cinnamomea TaxID=349313 RepID=A0A4Q7ZK95_9ACTN|nr:type 2 lanthipeptide synthetase LanM [Krasilnikovia cinnamomea]RZU51340.1 type 2 lantibiotic biosynthesis protein LanM [Krasilnikovia cinnamomea]